MLRLRSLHSRESHSLTNSGFKISTYRMAIGNPGGHFSSFHPLPVMSDSERASVIKKDKTFKKEKNFVKEKAKPAVSYCLFGLCHSSLLNIRGNRYRLVVVIKFVMGYIFIRFVGTHQEYDKIDCADI